MPPWLTSTQKDGDGKAYTIKGAGMLISTVTFELSPTKISYFRKQTAIWELAAYIGGFAVTILFFGQ